MRELQRQIHQVTVEKGWWTTSRPALEIHMLIVSEVAEATEEVRTGSPAEYYLEPPGSHGMVPGKISLQDYQMLAGGVVVGYLKPEGEAVELADAVIRIMDYFEAKGWDLEGTIQRKMDYNRTRPYRHGGKIA